MVSFLTRLTTEAAKMHFLLVTHLPQSFKMKYFVDKDTNPNNADNANLFIDYTENTTSYSAFKNAETPVDDYIRCMITDIMSQHIFKNMKTYQLFLKHPWFGVP